MHVQQVVVHSPPAFHLFYATGWQDAAVHMRFASPSDPHAQVCPLLNLYSSMFDTLDLCTDSMHCMSSPP